MTLLDALDLIFDALVADQPPPPPAVERVGLTLLELSAEPRLATRARDFGTCSEELAHGALVHLCTRRPPTRVLQRHEPGARSFLRWRLRDQLTRARRHHQRLSAQLDPEALLQPPLNLAEPLDQARQATIQDLLSAQRVVLSTRVNPTIARAQRLDDTWDMLATQLLSALRGESLHRASMARADLLAQGVHDPSAQDLERATNTLHQRARRAAERWARWFACAQRAQAQGDPSWSPQDLEALGAALHLVGVCIPDGPSLARRALERSLALLG